jgi:excisionase family DNA binding protein
MEVDMTQQLLTSEEVADLLRLKPQTVRDAAWRGKLPCVRLWSGKKKSLLRFHREDIEALIRARRISVDSGGKTT